MVAISSLFELSVGGVVNAESLVQHKDDPFCHCWVKDNPIQALNLLCREIERLKRREALAPIQDLNTKFVEPSEEWFLVVAPDGRVLDVSASMERAADRRQDLLQSSEYAGQVLLVITGPADTTWVDLSPLQKK